MRSKSMFRVIGRESQADGDDLHRTVLVNSCAYTTGAGRGVLASGDVNTRTECDDGGRPTAPIRLLGLRHERERCLVAAPYETPVPPDRPRTNAPY